MNKIFEKSESKFASVMKLKFQVGNQEEITPCSFYA